MNAGIIECGNTAGGYNFNNHKVIKYSNNNNNNLIVTSPVAGLMIDSLGKAAQFPLKVLEKFLTKTIKKCLLIIFS